MLPRKHASTDLNERVVPAIQVGEYTILILQATEHGSFRFSFRLWSLSRSSAEGSQESATSPQQVRKHRLRSNSFKQREAQYLLTSTSVARAACS